MSYITATVAPRSLAASGGDGDTFIRSSMADGSFAQALRERVGQGGTTVADLFPGLRDAFPGLTLLEGGVASGLRAADAHYRQAGGDAVSVDSRAARLLADDRQLAERLQDAIAAFLTAGSAVPPAIADTMTQRTVTVTVTTVRFSVFHRVSGTGETATAGEVTTSLDEKLRELIAWIFGRSALAGDEDTGEGTEEGRTALEFMAASATMNWRVELFYSRYSLDYYDKASSPESVLDSLLSARSTSSFAAVFGQITGSVLPGSFLAGVGSTGYDTVLASLFSGMGTSITAQTGGAFLFTMTAGASVSLWDALTAASSQLALPAMDAVPAQGGDGDAEGVLAV